MSKFFKLYITAFCFFLMPFHTLWAQSIQTTIGSYNGSNCNIGDTIVLPVNVIMATGTSIGAISMAIDFDTTKLRCIPTSVSGSAYATNVNAQIAFGLISNVTIFNGLVSNPPFTDARRRQIRIQWSSLSAASFNGLMFNLRFVVVATGSSSVKWDLATAGNCEYADSLANPILNSTFGNGNINCLNSVNPPCTPPQINLNIGGPTTFCQGGSVLLRVDSGLGLMYQWRNNGININGATNNNLTVSGSGSYSVVVSSSQNCSATSGPVVVNVVPQNTISLSSSPGTNGQVVTVNSSIVPVNFTTSGATGVTITGLPAGVSGSWSVNSVTISGTPVDTGTFNYLVTMTGGCPGAINSASGYIRVNGTSSGGGGGNSFRIQTTIGSYNGSNCNIGDTIVLPVNVNMVSGTSVGAISMGIDFDTTKLRCIPTSVSGSAYVTNVNTQISSGLISNVTIFPNLVPNPPYTNSSRRQVRIQWSSLSSASFNGLMFNLRFVVVSTGSSAVKWDLATTGNCEYADSLANPIGSASVSFVDGLITCGSPCIPPTSSIISPDTVFYCSGDSVTLSANSGVGLGYQWWRNDTLIAGASALSLTTSTSGLYKVQVFSGGCSSFSQNIRLIQKIVSVSISPAGPQTLCPESSVSLTATQITGALYQWRRNNTVLVGATNSMYLASQPGMYRVTIFSNGCSAVSTDVEVITPVPPSSILNYPDTISLCLGDTFLLSAQGGFPISFQWYNGSLPIVGAISSQFTVRDTGTYYVLATLNGCPFQSKKVHFRRLNYTPAQLHSSLGTESQVVCLNSPIVPIVYSATGFSAATFTGLPPGISGTFLNGQAIIQGVSTVSGLYPFKILYSTICLQSNSSSESNGFIQIVNCVTDTTIILSIGSSSRALCNVGDTISIPVTISMPINRRIGAISLALNYDSSKLQCLGASILNSSLTGSFVSNCSYFVGLGANGLGTGSQWRGAWSSINPVNFSGEILLLRFRRSNTGSVNLNWDVSSSGLCEFSDSNGVVIGNLHAINGIAQCGVSCSLPNPVIYNLGDSTFCNEIGTQLVASTLTGASYQWRRNGVNIAGATSSLYRPTQGGVFDLVVSLGSCVASSNSLNLSSSPRLNLQLNAGSNSLCSGRNLNLLVSGGLSNSIYRWYRNGILISNAQGNSLQISQGGSYKVLSNSGGCVSESNVVIIFENQNYYNQVNITLCQGATYTFNNQILFLPGAYYANFTSANGCDSTVSLNLDFVRASNTSITRTICSGDTFNVGIYKFYQTGSYFVNLVGSNNCDSTVGLALSVLSPIYRLLTASICESDTFYLGNRPIYTSGVYTDTLMASSGCDSIVRVTLEVKPKKYSSITATICQGIAYLFGGQPYTTSGSYIRTVTSSTNCDSIITLNLVVQPASTSSLNASICQNRTYIFGSQVLTSAGTYTRTIPAANGCDSVITLTLALRSNSTASIAQSICEGQSFTFGSQVLTSAGTYTRTIPSANGCDSVITLTLALRSNSTASIAQSICEGQSFTFGSQMLTSAGTYTRTIPSANGCDSVITLALALRSNSTASIVQSICEGQSFTFGSQVLTLAGTYTRTIPSAYGCDSVITLTLALRSNSTASIAQSICEGQSFTFGSQVLTSAGTYTRTIPSANGCDSVITLTLALRSNSTASIAQSICEGQSFTFGSQVLTSAGTYTRTVPSANGCDSVITLTLSYWPTPNSLVSASGSLNFCRGGQVNLQVNNIAGQQYQWYRNGSILTSATNANFTVTEAGNYSVTITNVHGCTATSGSTQVVVYDNPVATVSAGGPTTFCQGGSVVLNANQGPGLTYQWLNSGLDITGAVQPSYVATATGSYALRVTNANGCSAISSTIQVIVNPQPNVQIYASGPTTFCVGGFVNLCTDSIAGATYQWRFNGQNIAGAVNSCFIADTTGSYTVMVTLNQCSSLTSAIIVNQFQLSGFSISAGGPTSLCQGSSVLLSSSILGTSSNYQWFRNGIPIPGSTAAVFNASLSGSYFLRIIQNGCAFLSNDIIVFVNPLPSAVVSPGSTVTICSGDSAVLSANTGLGLVYQWLENGIEIPGGTNSSLTVNTSGVYSVRVSNSAGCISISNNVPVSVNPLPVITVFASGNLSFCLGDSVVLNSGTTNFSQYQWFNGNTAITGATNQQYVASISGVYKLKATNNNGCSNFSNLMIINVIQPSSYSMIDSFCQGATYQFGANVITQPGSYSDTLINVNGCDSIISLTLRVINKPLTPSVSISSGRDTLFANPLGNVRWFRNGLPLTGGVNGVLPISLPGTYYAVRDSLIGSRLCTSDTSNRIYKSGVNVSSQNLMDLNIYPNPTSGLLYLVSKNFNIFADHQISLYTTTGVYIGNNYEVVKTDNGLILDLSGLPDATYLIHWISGSSKTVSKIILHRE
jgi:hypothetical protein